MNGRKRLKLYAGGAVLGGATLWACWWWMSSEYSPLLYEPPQARRPPTTVRRPSVAVPAAAKPRPLPSDAITLMKRLSVGADQPGIVVCEPVARSGDPSIARFGTGCSRWISFALGGVPALGSTPSWDTIATVLPTAGLRDLRLSPEQARQLARPLGVPFAAVGEISGTPASAALTYQLYEIPSGKAKGSPVTVTGTLELITGKLPEVAAGMLRAANVPETRVGDGLTETASTLTALGVFPWRVEAAVPKELEKLSYRSTLAGVVMLTRMDVWDLPRAERIQQDLAMQFPGHPLALQMAVLCLDAEPRPGSIALREVIRNGEEIRRQYPFSCLTQMALAMAYWRNSQSDDGRDAAEAAVLACNRSAEAWSLLATLTDSLAANAASAANQADLARAMAQMKAMQQGYPGATRPTPPPAAAQGANTSALPGGRSPDQDAWYRGTLLRKQVAPLFRKAVALDDRRWDIWRNYASAACRDGDWATASAAFWKAAPLSAGDSDTIHAGLDLWGEWHPQPKEFQRVVEFALAHPSPSRLQRDRLAGYFSKHGLGAAARKMMPVDPQNQTAEEVAASRRVTLTPVPKKPALVPPIKTAPPADLSRQKTAGPWLIGKPGGRISRLTWSPDGGMLAMADGWSGPVVWNGGTSVRRFGGAPQGWMYDVAWTGSGELVGAVQDGRLVYWNAANGQTLRTVPRPRGASARSIAIRPSGDRIVYREENQLYSLFSMPERRRIPMRVAVPGSPSDAAFSPDGAMLATVVNAGNGTVLLLRSADDGRELRRIEPPGNVGPIAWRPDSKAIALGVSDDTVRVYDVEGKELTTRHVPYQPQCMAWGPGGKLLAFSVGDEFQTWNPTTGDVRQAPRGHKQGVILLAWDLHGDRIATWGYDGALLLWNPNALAPAPTLVETPTAETAVLSPWKNFVLPDRTYVGHLEFSPDSRALTAASTTQANLYDLDTGRPVQQFKPQQGGSIDRVLLSPDGKTAYGIGSDRVWAWDRATAQERWTWKWPRNPAGVSFFSRDPATLSPDGRWLVGALREGDGLHVWETASGENTKQLPVYGTPFGVEFSPDGKLLALAYGSDRRWADIELYDAHTLKAVGTLTGHRDTILALCFSPDGSALASLSKDRTVRLWSVATRKQLRSLPAMDTQDGIVTFLSGGKRLFVQSGPQVRTWEASTGKLLKDVQLKKENLSTLTFSADGKLAANRVMNNVREQKWSVQVWRVTD